MRVIRSRLWLLAVNSKLGAASLHTSCNMRFSGRTLRIPHLGLSAKPEAMLKATFHGHQIGTCVREDGPLAA